MKTIWKILLTVTGKQIIKLPPKATILSVQQQQGSLYAWVMVNPAASPMEERHISIFGTGHPIDSDYNLHYLGTIQQMGGTLVWHVFEEEV